MSCATMTGSIEVPGSAPVRSSMYALYLIRSEKDNAALEREKESALTSFLAG